MEPTSVDDLRTAGLNYPSQLFMVRIVPMPRKLSSLGNQRQIHDLSRCSEKPIGWVTVRQWQLLGGQYNLVAERRLPLRRGSLRQAVLSDRRGGVSCPGH